MLASHDPQLLKQSSMTLTFNYISVYWQTHIYFCVPVNTHLVHALFMNVLKYSMEISMSEDVWWSCGGWFRPWPDGARHTHTCFIRTWVRVQQLKGSEKTVNSLSCDVQHSGRKEVAEDGAYRKRLHVQKVLGKGDREWFLCRKAVICVM